MTIIRIDLVVCLVLLVCAFVASFQDSFRMAPPTHYATSRRSFSGRLLFVASDLERPSTFLDDDDESNKEKSQKSKLNSRWENLNPKLKQKLIEKGQAKAIANKQKREPKQDKKRRESSASDYYSMILLWHGIVRLVNLCI
jgi:hypothetical protein